MKHSVPVTCFVCDGAGTLIDSRGVPVICYSCLGECVKDGNPDGPACSIEAHERAVEDSAFANAERARDAA